MSQEKEKNIAHVIYHQLRRIAKANDEDFSILLARYGMERFIQHCRRLHSRLIFMAILKN